VKLHWSEYTSCLCGQRFRIDSIGEARHRHNFPLLCKNREGAREKNLKEIANAT
jgi:hypothetical protein